MAKIKQKPSFDGATLSPKLTLKAGRNADTMSLPIGKAKGVGGTEVARAYKHAAGKSNTYSPHVVDMIYHMARNGPLHDKEVCQFVAAKLTAERDLPRTSTPVTWDQLVFLSANLTRLVIDPYRERCNSRVQVGIERPRPLTLEWPIVYDGVHLNHLPEPLFACFVRTAREAGLAITIGPDGSNITPHTEIQHIVQVDAMRPLPPISAAAAVQITMPVASQMDRQHLEPVVEAVRNATDAQIPLGVVAPAWNAQRVVDQTIELGVDFYVADGQWLDDVQPVHVFPELETAPAIHVLADTVERLRYHRREETVSVIYRGGIRGGADAGKAICLGATAVALGLSAVVGMGFRITAIRDEQTLLDQLTTEKQQHDQIAMHLYNFAKSVNMELTMLARACGKTSVTNMEPEDLRALTIETSAATGIPLVGKDQNFRHDRPAESRT